MSGRILRAGADPGGDGNRPFFQIPQDLPPALERVIKRCLETDPDERWQSARDLQWELESIAQTPAEALSGSLSKVPARGLALATIAGIALWWSYFCALASVLRRRRWRA